MKEKVIAFHSFFVPMITAIICLYSTFMYAFTLEGLFYFLLLVYNLYVFYSFITVVGKYEGKK